jgi:hypothetical protein
MKHRDSMNTAVWFFSKNSNSVHLILDISRLLHVISDSSICIVPKCHFRFQLLCACVNVLSTADLCNRGHLHQATLQNVTSTYAVVLKWRPLCCLSAVMCPPVVNTHQWWALHDACYHKSTLISIHAGRHTCWPLHMLSPKRAVLYVCCP